MARWLLKSEPDVFGYDDLVRVGREPWDGIRNYQARNFLRTMQVGELAIFYHSRSQPPGAAGICEIAVGAEPDPTQFEPDAAYFDPTSRPDDPRWDLVTVAPVRRFAHFVTLAELRALPELAGSRLLARGNRLSVLPLTDSEFDAIVGAGDVSADATAAPRRRPVARRPGHGP